MIWTLSVMLWYVDVPNPTLSFWQHETFDTKIECHRYLADNKVNIVDTVLESFRNNAGMELKNFEFFCESTTLVNEV